MGLASPCPLNRSTQVSRTAIKMLKKSRSNFARRETKTGEETFSSSRVSSASLFGSYLGCEVERRLAVRNTPSNESPRETFRSFDSFVIVNLWSKREFRPWRISPGWNNCSALLVRTLLRRLRIDSFLYDNQPDEVISSSIWTKSKTIEFNGKCSFFTIRESRSSIWTRVEVRSTPCCADISFLDPFVSSPFESLPKHRRIDLYALVCLSLALEPRWCIEPNQRWIVRVHREFRVTAWANCPASTMSTCRCRSAICSDRSSAISWCSWTERFACPRTEERLPPFWRSDRFDWRWSSSFHRVCWCYTPSNRWETNWIQWPDRRKSSSSFVQENFDLPWPTCVFHLAKGTVYSRTCGHWCWPRRPAALRSLRSVPTRFLTSFEFYRSSPKTSINSAIRSTRSNRWSLGGIAQHWRGKALPKVRSLSKSHSPSIGWIIVFHRRFHIFQFVENGEHVDKFSQRQQIRFTDEFFPFLVVAQTSNLMTKGFHRSDLEEEEKRSDFFSTDSKNSRTEKCIIAISFATSGCSASTVFS